MKDEVAAATRYGAETTGTFVLVFTLGCCAHSESVASALSAGAVLTALIYGLGPVSGGHFNPAATFALHLADRSKISLQDAAGYICAQMLGAVIGAMSYFHTIGRTQLLRPVGVYSALQVAAVEVIYTAALCYVFLNVTIGMPRSHFGGFAIGSTVTAAAVAAGPISGCSLNPAVAAGAVCIAGAAHGPAALSHHCAYLFAPFVGAAVGTLAFFAAGGGSFPGLGSGPTGSAAECDPLLGEARQGMSPLNLSDAQYHRCIRPSSRLAYVTYEDTPREQSISSLRVVRHAPLTLPAHIIGHDLFFACRWRMRQERAKRGEPVVTCDIDLSCAKLSRTGEHIGGVYFAEARDLENGIRHSGDEVMGEGDKAADNELIRFRLSDIKPNVFALVFFVGIYDATQNFGHVSDLRARLVDSTPALGSEEGSVTVPTGGREICRYEKKDFLPQANALIAAMLYRQGGDWVFKAVDESFDLPPHSSYRKLLPEMQELVRKVQSQGPPSSSGKQR